MNYYIEYVKNCTPHIKSFKSKKQADLWLDKFYRNSAGPDHGDWIELYFKGTIYEYDKSLGNIK